MRIDLVYPILPPTINGIGDHTVHMARALSDLGVDVRVLTGRDQSTAVPGIEVVPAFSVSPRSGVSSLPQTLEIDPPDWMVLQFEQFSYGRWGLNPYLPYTLHRIKRLFPNTNIATMVHEDFVSATERPQFALMSLWQRPQFWAMGRIVDRLFFSIELWAQTYATWFPDTPTEHVPVGSNIPRQEHPQRDARDRLDLPADAFVVGIFGSAHPSRQLDRIGSALTHMSSLLPNVHTLYVGTAGATVRQALPDGIPFFDAGPRPPEEVSTCFHAMDLYLAPFENGVSTRRGSFLVGLQHGVPTISTSGRETDALLHEENQKAFVLVPWDDETAFREATQRLVQNDDRRVRMSRRARSFFDDTFAWPRLASKLITALTHSGTLTRTGTNGSVDNDGTSTPARNIPQVQPPK